MLKKIIQNKKPRYFIVLTPYWKKPAGEIEAQFRQVIISHFIDQVETLKRKHDRYHIDSNTSHYHFYKDFITTIRNRKIEIDMIKDYQEFISEGENLEKLHTVYNDLQTIKRILDSKMMELNKQLSGFRLIESSKDKLFSVIEKKAFNQSTKVRLTLKGWSVECWENKNKVSENSFEFDTELSAIVNRINLVLNSVK